ncbi:MAG TPA: hypothetical protein VJB57_17245 [Dehalococcoidia bacterium]|nr:hypothetical protein [Dehalococcoidia bacterium]
MKKLAMFAAGLVVAGSLAFGVMGAGVASANEPELENEFGPRPWLRHAIVLAAAQTIGVPVEQIQAAMQHGASLKEIGMRHGDRPAELSAGIVRHVHTILDNWVADGRITPEMARHGNQFVQSHIRLIINNHFEPGPGF